VSIPRSAMRSRTSSLTGPFPSSSLFSPSGSLTVRACLRWKTACLSGLGRGRIGPFLRPGDVASLDGRKHPFQAHPSQTLLLASPSQEPSFPSDHAVAAFAIAFSVALVRGRRAGVFFLAAASVVITRVFVGLHYPGDIAGGALIGLIAALAVFSPGPNRWSPVVAMLSRLTDPLVAPVGKRSTPRKGFARSTRTGAVFRLSGGGGIRTLDPPNDG
jgi:membrane-associated phospholipid phosphatase